MDQKKVSDAVCVIAAAVLLIMTIMSILESKRADYQVNTGLFCAFFCLIPMIFRRLKIVTLPLAFVLMIQISIFLHAYGVLLMQYDMIQTWDTVTHSISSITVALCVFYALISIDHFDTKMRITRKMMPLFIFFIMLTFSAYWEVFEFIVDELWQTNMQYSPWDTIRDLVCDIFGATVISIYSYLYLKRDGREFIESLEIHPLLKKMGSSKA